MPSLSVGGGRARILASFAAALLAVLTLANAVATAGPFTDLGILDELGLYVPFGMLVVLTGYFTVSWVARHREATLRAILLLLMYIILATGIMTLVPYPVAQPVSELPGNITLRNVTSVVETEGVVPRAVFPSQQVFIPALYFYLLLLGLVAFFGTILMRGLLSRRRGAFLAAEPSLPGAVQWSLQFNEDDPRRRVVLAYRYACDRLTARGLQRTAYQTTGEYAYVVAVGKPGAREVFADLTRLYEEARFSYRMIAQWKAERAAGCLVKLTTQLGS